MTTHMFIFEIPAAKGALAIGGVMLGSGLAVRGAELLADATIGNSSSVELGVLAAACGGVWYLGRVLQRLQDGNKANGKRLSRIERKLGISEDSDDSDKEDE